MQIVSLRPFQALLLETPAWKNVSTIELIDTGLSDFALGRLSRCVILYLLDRLPFGFFTLLVIWEIVRLAMAFIRPLYGPYMATKRPLSATYRLLTVRNEPVLCSSRLAINWLLTVTLKVVSSRLVAG